MLSEMTTIQVKVRIPAEDAKVLDKLGGAIFSRNDMATMLLHAAVEAVKEDPGKLKFPPMLLVASTSEANSRLEVNEPKPSTKARK